MADASKLLPEPDRICARDIALAAAGLVALLAVAGAAVFFLWRGWHGDALPQRPAMGDPRAGAAPLESAPREDRAAYDAAKRKLLTGWEWIDRRNGIARIPVEQAMQILAARDGHAGSKP
jgi:hypothetical protein